jgi:DNA-binding Lrp family transcriptional regulator
MKEIKLDEIDIKLIRTLQNDARTSLKEVARECNVSIDTIKNRYNILKKIGVIRGSTIVLNPKEIGQGNLVFFGIQIMHHYSDSVINLVKKIPGMYVVTKAIGRYDIEAIAILDNIEKIGATKNIIGDFQQVKNVDVDILVDKPLLCPRNFEF